MGAKAVLESGLGSANVVAQDRRPGIVPILFERLTVADLMPNTTTTSNTVRAVVESTATNNAATVAEGAAKPASVLNYNVVDEPIRKIANYIKVSDEMLEDLPYVQSQISGRLSLFVQIQEEAQLLTGDGTGQNLVGILNRSGLTAAQAKGSDSVAVAIHKEITKIRVASFLDPDAIVLHPNDWEGAALESDANGQFYGPGPFTGPYGNNQPNAGTYGGTYWGLRVVVTQAETQNTALVGAFGLGAEVVRRSGVTVTMTNTDQDDFIKNLVTILAEERVGLRVIRPAAFGTVTGV
jgi:HK97 family phage major capsid protein